MTIRTRDTLVFSTLILISMAFLLWIIPAYTPPYPGYGVSADLLPNITVGAILVLSVISLAQIIWRHRKAPGGPEEQKVPENQQVHLLHLALFLVPCVLMMPAMQTIGFLPAGIAFLLIISLLCGQRRLVPLTLTSVIPVLSVYALMRWGLGVPMP